MSDRAENLNQVLLVAMHAFAGRACLRVPQGTQFRQVTYRELEDLSFRVAAFFRRRAFCPGDRVAIVAENSAEWLAAYLGCLLVGGVAVPLRASLPTENLAFMIDHTNDRSIPDYCKFFGSTGTRVRA